jgi:hypothetical protein
LLLVLSLLHKVHQIGLECTIHGPRPQFSFFPISSEVALHLSIATGDSPKSIGIKFFVV